MSKNERKPSKIEERIEETNKTIKKKKLRWKAKKTSLSELSEIEIRQRLGLVIPKEELDRKLKEQEKREKKRISDAMHASPVDPPSSWDWRDVNGTNWTTRIRNQGWCGSCVAFGVIAVLEMMLKKWGFQDANVDPKLIDFSEAHLFFVNNRHCRLYSCNLPPNNVCAAPNAGWSIVPALDYLKANWICYEDCFPYNGPNRPCNSCVQVCVSQQPPGGTWNPGQPCSGCNQPCTQALTLCPEWPYDINYTKIKDWKAIYSKEEMKKTLSEHGCLVTGFAVYEDFFDYGSGVYEHATGNFAGGHAVAVVGYSDVDDCWICKNSWGTNWGEAGGGEAGGWFRIAYNECGIDEVMYKIDLFCPAEESGRTLGLSQDAIQLVRFFRDDLLTTRKGKAYLDLAQANIGLVTRSFFILRKNVELRKEAEKALEPFIKAIQSRNSLRPFKLTQEHYKAGMMVLKKMAKLDRKLASAVKRIEQEYPKYVGKNINDVMRELF